MKSLGEEGSKELRKRYEVNELSVLFTYNQFVYQVVNGVVHLRVEGQNGTKMGQKSDLTCTEAL